MKLPKRPPLDLSDAAKAWYTAVRREYAIDDPGGLWLLETAAHAYARMEDARTRIAEEGPIIPDRAGCPRAHPMLQVERDARSGLIQSLKALHLDLEPVRDRIGRPGGPRPVSRRT